MISVLVWNYNRPDMLEATIPKWLAQEGVEYEIVLGHGPSIKPPVNAKIRPVLTPNLRLGQSYNKLIQEAKGEYLLLTQSDMEVNDPHQVQRMLEVCKPGYMVTERFFKNGVRDAGVHLQFMLVRKEDMVAIGGWCEMYDNPDMCAYEDSDVVARLMNRGLKFKMLETPPDKGVYHIWHPAPDYVNDRVVCARVENAKELFFSRHGKGIWQIYAEQFARMMTEKVCPM